MANFSKKKFIQDVKEVMNAYERARALEAHFFAGLEIRLENKGSDLRTLKFNNQYTSNDSETIESVLTELFNYSETSSGYNTDDLLEEIWKQVNNTTERGTQ